ncbi:MAG: transport-associated protein(predicted periplasmic or secreted lipoprotein) [Candidatus Solibacter sp.]|nr:transport-associated protein(predicted periplasmic or secreted lipoprotein) [Candidatus Solibacter sp.]
MVDDSCDLIKGVGLFVGVLLGGILGPGLFFPTGLNDPRTSTLGAFSGAVLGFGLASAVAAARRRRRDQELQLAANSVLRDAGFAMNFVAEIKNARLTLAGEADHYSQRQFAERIVSTVPGIASVTNGIRLRMPNGRTDAEEIKRNIAEAFKRGAQLAARGIHARVDRSRIVLEGTVQSRAESSEAEELAWSVPGIQQVENRLEIAAPALRLVTQRSQVQLRRGSSDESNRLL